MLKKIKKYLLNTKNYLGRLFKGNKKINEYKNRKKSVGPKKNRERNKYNLQLNINFKGKKLKKFFLIIFLIIFIIIAFLIKGPFFKIQEINIIKLDENVNTRLIEKKLNNIKGSLLFKVKNQYIEKEIRDIEQNIKEINISKIPPSKINIRLSSYGVIFKTELNGNKYLITENGVFLPTKGKNSQYIDIKVKNLDLQNYPNYKKILKTNNLYKIKYLESKLKDNIVNLKIDNIIYYKIAKEVHFIINNKTRLIFDLEGIEGWDLDEKLKQLFVFNKEKIDITKPGIIYIDNRTKSKIFHCPELEVNRCIKNINYIYDEKLRISDY